VRSNSVVQTNYDLILIFTLSGGAINSLALTYIALKRPEDAVPLQEKLLEFRKRTLPADDPLIGDTWNVGVDERPPTYDHIRSSNEQSCVVFLGPWKAPRSIGIKGKCVEIQATSNS
jgi:hypothetical protein